MKTNMRGNKNTQMIKVKEKNITKYIHITLIVLGSIFVLLSSFHTNLWFDESYSVSMAKNSFADIWRIGSTDVHPVLYYFMLKVVGLLTGNSILAYRLFSAMPLIILAILGFSHIKKDFGEKVGFAFSFLVLFMPVTLIYASEIRMYTWELLFVSLMSIYAYRIYRSGVSKKNWIIFSIFSLASAYTHYYGTLAATIINIGLFIYFAVNNIRQRNYEVKYIKYSKNLKYSVISSIIQILIFLPWIGVVLNQFKTVKQGFWIPTANVLELLDFQFTGNLPDRTYLIKELAYIFIGVLVTYNIYRLIKNRKDAKPVYIAFGIYITTILITAIISIFVKILYPRYLLTITGLLLFAFAYLLAKDKNRIRVGIVCTIILVFSIIENVGILQENYDSSNIKPYEFIKENINNQDIIVTNSIYGLTMASYFQNNEVYFLNEENWNIEKAYETYGKTVYDFDFLKEFEGNIWVITSIGNNLKDNIENEFKEQIKIINNEEYNVRYKNYNYSISLIQK